MMFCNLKFTFTVLSFTLLQLPTTVVTIPHQVPSINNFLNCIQFYEIVYVNIFRVYILNYSTIEFRAETLSLKLFTRRMLQNCFRIIQLKTKHLLMQYKTMLENIASDKRRHERRLSYDAWSFSNEIHCGRIFSKNGKLHICSLKSKFAN